MFTAGVPKRRPDFGEFLHMVAIVTGNGLGLERSSAWILGARGQVGSAGLGRDNEDLYVNAATGNLVIHGNDEILLGRFVGANVGHTYNSLSAGGYDNGDNWMPDAARQVTGLTGTLNSSGSTITRTDWDGSAEVFTWDTTISKYVFKEGKGADDTLSFASNVWTWTDGDTQTTELYDSLNGGRITNVYSPMNCGLTYTYTDTFANGGKIDRITTLDNEYVKFTWSGNNLTALETHTTVEGTATTTRVRYTYDGSNRLASVTTDLSPGDNATTDNNVYTISYTYDGSSNRIASIAQQDGSLIQFTYTLVGSDYRVASYTQTVSAGVTRTTTFDYTVAGRTTVTDPAGQKTILFYDSANRLTQISYPLENGNTTPRVVQFTYDSAGNVLTAKLGPGNIITYDYIQDRLLMQRDSAGNTVTYSYGTQNQLLAEAHYLVPDPDGSGSGAPSTPATTHYAYDTSLRMTFAVSAEGHVTEYRYNDAGLRSVQIDYTADIYTGTDFSDSALASWAGSASKVANQLTDTTYDNRGNVSTVTTYTVIDGTTGAGLTAADYSRTTYVYDYGGRLLSRHTNADSTSEVFVYDGLGRLTSSTDFGGNLTKTYFLDSVGQTVLTHANGLSEVSTYNRAGELIAHAQSTAGANLVDLSGWPGNPASAPSGQATVTNWQNPSSFVEEAHWASTVGPDGLQVVAMQSGQHDVSGAEDAVGGGNTTNNVTIDPTKAYEFTYYFKFSDVHKHYVFFGVSSTSPSTVLNQATGADDSNGYFFYAYPDGNMEANNFTVDKWYKVVGYVLPYNTSEPSTAKYGGVYDVATGQKVLDDYVTYRWASSTQTQVWARFINYYGQAAATQGDSTYFYQPEIRQVSVPTVIGPDSTTSLYRYDSLGRLRMTVDPTGRRNYMMYDSLNRKVADIDADGSVIEYRYDGNDNVTSTTRYATRLSSSQLASLVDSYGNPTSAIYGASVTANGTPVSATDSLRPAASADDQWTFQVYDAAQRLRQTIDGTGATTVYNYDGASRLVSTKAYANRLSSTVIANLKAEASNPNLWANPGNAALWATTNLTVTEFSTSPKTYIEGVEAFKFTVTNANQYEAFASGSFTAKTGDTLSYSISVEAVTGSITVDVTGIYGSSSSWGNSSDSSATIVSGPGAITQWTGGLFTISGLTSDNPTRITITRKLLQDESATVAFYVRSLDYSATTTNDKVVIAAPVFTATHSTLLNLPDDDSTHDRVTRSFYDKDGRLIGTLDGEGYLTETRYDGAGRKTQTIAYWNATGSAYRASGSIDDLRGSIAADTAKDIHNHFVYDPRGLLRATVDGEGILTRYYYTPSGDVYEVRTGQQLDPVALISTPPTFTNLPAEPSGAIVSVTNYAYDANHRPTDVSVTLTGSTTTTTTHHTYDSMGRLLSTTTQYGGTDPRTVARRYDLRGRLTGELDAIGYASLPGSPTQAQIDAAYAAHGISYAYDAADRLTSSTDANGRKTLYYYDTDGRLVYQIDPLGEVVEYRYDALGQRSDTISYAARLGSLTGLVGGNVTAGLTSAVTALASSTFDHAVHIDFNLDGTVKQSTDRLGNVTAYSYNGFGETEAIVAPLDASRSIETDTFYDRRGLLKTQIVDAGTGHLGIITTYGYDAFGRALTLTNALSKDTTTTYDRDGRVKTVTDALLNTTTNTWDSRGNLVAVTDAANKVTRFVYDKANRRIATIDARGGVVTSTYDADGRVVSTRAYSTAISLSGLATEVTESVLPSKLPSPLSSDQVTNYVYDKDGQLRFTVDALMHVVENRYDAVGNVIRTIAYDGTISAPSSYTESALTSAVASLASAAGTRITRAVYDAADRLSFAIDALNQVTAYVYDSEGRLIKQTEFAALYTGADTTDPSLTTMSSSFGSAGSNDRVTRAYYDRKGQLNFSIDALGYVTRMDYDKDGNVTKQTRYADAYTASDSTTLQTLVTDSAFTSPPTTRRETSFAYDSAGRLQRTTDPEGYVTWLTLDAMGRITFSEEAYGTTTDASVTAYSYDDVGRTTSVTRGYGTSDASTTWFFYDSLGRQQARVDGDKYLTVWGYDDNGNCTSETHFAGAITGTVTATTSVTTLQGWAGSADPATSTHYDALNRIDYVTDARSSVTSRTYNALGEVLDETEQMESGTGDDRITHWTYDSFGDAVTVTDPRNNQTISFYDKLGRVKRVSDPYQYFTDTTYTRGGKVASVTLWANAFTASTVTAGTYPGNPTADSTRDQLTVFTYDKDDRLTAVTDAENYTEGYTLNGFGERTDVRNKLYVSSTFDTTVHYTYDKRGLVLTETLPVTTKNSGGTTISVVNHYEYDGRGNRKLMVEAYGAAEARTTNYQYDTLDRLIGTTHDVVSVVNDDLTTTTGITPGESMKYDRRGNVIEKIDAGGARTLFWYDDLGRATDQLVQSYRDIATSTDKGTLTHTTYDGNGNALTVTVYGDLVTLPTSWTATIPSPVNSANCRLVTYAYDRSNRLHTTTVSGLRTGEFASGTWSFSTSDIVTTLDYDMAGNVIHQEDGRLNDVYTWYDKLNRKVAQVDAENYLTTWSYNADGNVSSETRYATPLSSFTAPSASTVPTPPSGSSSADNRTTNFVYDRNGRRTSETRTGVDYTWVNASTGAGNDVTGGSSTVTYEYNGLGQVTKKTQVLDAHATPVTDVVNYDYDKIGRLIQETDPSFTDITGATLTPRTVFTYDGLGNLLKQRLQAGATANDTNDRVTTYTYGAGGRMATMTDAAGFTHSYGYDKAGRVVRDSYTRTLSNGTSTVTEAQVTRYDIAGRAITQTFARLSGSTWVFTDAASRAYAAVRIHYNAFGDVDGRGLTAGPTASAVYQETFDYDSGGRLWRSNAGDGVLRFYVYDKAGNRTLTLTSTGADLSTLTLGSSTDYTGSITTSGDTSTTDAVTTISVFDRRGMELQTREPDRKLSASGSSQVIVHAKTYNAFGEVATETDPRGFDTSGSPITFTGGAGYTTTYQYNTMGRLTARISPQVSVTSESGVAANANPTEHYGYDLSGRLVSVMDANTNRTTRLLLAGSGHDGADPLVAAEFHPNHYAARTFYNVFGDATVLRDELSHDETYTFDKMGRATAVAHRGGRLVDHYTYDELGQRIQHTQDWDSVAQSTLERTDYDYQGRMVDQYDMAANHTHVDYSWTATGIGYWTKATTDTASNSASENDDYFGRLTAKSDFGSHSFSYTYDLGGRLTQESGGGGQVITYAWLSTGNLSQAVDTAGTGMNAITATYAYDAAGNRTYEGYAGTVYSFNYGGSSYGGSTTSSTLTLQNATIAYDALNRIVSFTDKDASNATRITVLNEYDANGNVMRKQTSYPDLAYPTHANLSWDQWYSYDNMNRMTVAEGILDSGTITRGAHGYAIDYDEVGRRHSQTTNAGLTGTSTDTWVWRPGHGPGTGHLDDPIEPGETGDYVDVDVGYTGARREEYAYRDDGELYTVKFAETGYTDNHDGTVTPTSTFGSSVLRAQYDRDAMGRITAYQEFAKDGTTVTRNRYDILYDALNNITDEKLTQVKVESGVTNQYLTSTVNHYTNGMLTSTSSHEYKGGWDSASDALVPDTEMTYNYTWYDGARISSTSFDGDTSTTSNTPFTSTYYYDSLGRVGSVDIADGRRRAVSFAYTPEGQVLNRKERSAATGASANPEDQHYFVNGAQYGELTSNGNSDPELANYGDSLTMRNWTPAPAAAAFRWNHTSGATNGIFGGAGYQPLNPLGDGANSSDSRYIVRGGETLQSIAASVWGDASLWYLIASANGMSGGETLVAGTSIILPDRVTNMHNNAGTFRVYDPNRALGDLNPTNAKPPKKVGNCAVIGQILLTAVAIAVSIYTAGALSALGPILAGAIGGAAGSVVSQGLGIAAGLQHGFDFKGVALGAIGGAVGGALAPGGAFGNAGAFGKIGSSFVQGALRGAVTSLATQGVALATGLQHKFSWSGVAAAAFGGGLANAAASGLTPAMKLGTISSTLVNGISSMAGALANASARSLIDGTDFGDNLIAALPDVIGSTIGNWVSGVGHGGGSEGVRDARAAIDKVFKTGAPPVPTEMQIESVQDQPGEASQSTSMARLLEMLDTLPPVLGGADTRPQAASTRRFAGRSRGAAAAPSSDDNGQTNVETENRRSAQFDSSPMRRGNESVHFGDGPDSVSQIEWIHRYVGRPSAPYFIATLIERTGGPLLTAQNLFSYLRRNSANVWDTVNDLQAHAAHSREYGTSINETAGDLADLQLAYAREHPYETNFLSTINFFGNAAGEIWNGGVAAARFSSDLTIGTGTAAFSDLTGVHLPGWVPNIHHETDPLVRGGLYLADAAQGRVSLGDDLAAARDHAQNYFSSTADDVTHTYEQAGLTGLFDRYSPQLGRGTGFVVSVALPGAGEARLGASASELGELAPLLEDSRFLDLEPGDVFVGDVAGGTGARMGPAAGSGGVDLALTYKPGWSAAQRAEADLKVQILTESETVVSPATRSGTSAASRYRSAGNQIPAGNDIDHAVDLQLGGSDTLSNMWPLDSSVNRSLGAQIQHQIKNLPPGTVINKVTIGHR
jgi:YD repeat-containing protein